MNPKFSSFISWVWKKQNKNVNKARIQNKSPGGSDGKEVACNAGDQVWSLGREDPMSKGMATHSSILAWDSPWTEEPGGLQFTESRRVKHDWVTNTNQALTSQPEDVTRRPVHFSKGSQPHGKKKKEKKKKTRQIKCSGSTSQNRNFNLFQP